MTAWSSGSTSCWERMSSRVERSIISRVTAICGTSTNDCVTVPVDGKRDRALAFVLTFRGLRQNKNKIPEA